MNMENFHSDETAHADRGHRVLYVLAASLTLAAIAMIAVAFTGHVFG